MKSRATLKVQAGHLKGRHIEISKEITGRHSKFTPALLKKGLFSILDSLSLHEDLIKDDAVFFDLFSGSGQISLEALSRGFSKAILFELEKERISSLKELFKNSKQTCEIHHKDVFRYLKKSHSGLENKYLVYFFDPPYSFWENKVTKKKLMDLIGDLQNGNEDRFIFIAVQSDSPLELSGFEERLLGGSYLSVFQSNKT